MNPYLEKVVNGYKVIVSPDTPKMQLSEDCPVTPDFRIEMNQWMRSFFGTENLIPDGDCYVMETLQMIHMNPRTHKKLMDAIEHLGLQIKTTPEFPMLL